MQHDKTAPSPANPAIRQLAEIEVRENGRTHHLSEVDVRALCHELEVHQIELEMQNEELRRVRSDLAASEEKYRGLYEFAPGGYFILEPSGNILEANLAGAALLGTERAHLVKNRFQAYLAQSSIMGFNTFCHNVMESDAKQMAEFELNGRERKASAWVAVEARAVQNDVSLSFRMAVMDITGRKLADEALKESEERYRRLFEVESDAIFLVDCKSDEFIDANPAAQRIYGYSQEEFLSLKARDISAQPDKALQTSASHERHIPLEWHRRKDGTVFPVEISGNYFNFQGRTIHVAAIRDITVRKNIEARLKQSDSRYRILFKHSPISTLEEDYSKVKSRFDTLRSSGVSNFREYFHSHPEEAKSLASMAKVLDINQKGSEFLKISDVNQIPANLSAKFQESALNMLIEELAALAEGNTRFESEIPIRTIDGDNKIVSLNLSVVPGYENTLSRVLVSFTDITERIQAEKALQDSEEKYRLVVENANEAIIIAQDGFIKFANKRMTKLLGCTLKEITARPFQEFIYPDDREMVVERHKRRLAGEQIEDLYAFRVVTGDGNIRWVAISAVRIEWQGRPATLNFMSDITERKQVEGLRDHLVKELESKNAEMERFIYTVSHDLRSPLVTVSGFMGILKSDLANGKLERIDADLNVINSTIDKMDLLLRDTLELSRIGRVANPPDTDSFEAVAREVLSQLGEQTKARGIEVEVASNMPSIRVDRMRIAEVLVNLIENSMKYMGDQPYPKIEIGYRLNDGAFFVKDNGIGVDPSQHGKIFGLFYKINGKSEGTGAGLAIVKRIIEVHAGRIWIESELGKGCMVCFTLPMDEIGNE